MGKFVDLTGQKFGKLTVVSRAENDKHRNAMWVCKCDCGKECVVRGGSLKSNHTTSCGCLLKHNTFNLGYKEFIIMYDLNGCECLIDWEDYEKVKQHTWYQDKQGYFVSRIKNKLTKLHRFILSVKTGEVIDHINRIRFDCRKDNLRICTIFENNCNTPKQGRKTSSKYKGVFLRKDLQKWECAITHKGKKIHLGTYRSEKEAGLRYDEEAKKLFGEFGYLNFPDKKEGDGN